MRGDAVSDGFACISVFLFLALAGYVDRRQRPRGEFGQAGYVIYFVEVPIAGVKRFFDFVSASAQDHTDRIRPPRRVILSKAKNLMSFTKTYAGILADVHMLCLICRKVFIEIAEYRLLSRACSLSACLLKECCAHEIHVSIAEIHSDGVKNDKSQVFILDGFQYASEFLESMRQPTP